MHKYKLCWVVLLFIIIFTKKWKMIHKRKQKKKKIICILFFSRAMDTHRRPRFIFHANVQILHTWWILPDDIIRSVRFTTVYVYNMVLNVSSTLCELSKAVPEWCCSQQKWKTHIGRCCLSFIYVCRIYILEMVSFGSVIHSKTSRYWSTLFYLSLN